MKILLVEDEELLSEAIAKGLKKLGFAVDPVYDGEEALYFYEINSYDLIILDLNLPVVDGMEVLRRIREQDDEMKVLILSARSDTGDRVDGLNRGANDYLVKPFDFEELVARIHNLLRRKFSQAPTQLSVGELALDMAEKTVTRRGKLLSLTHKEYAVLEYLLLHRGRVIPQSELIEHVWNSEADPFSNSLKFHLHSLKKKLGEADCIANVRGQGYLIQGDENHE